jgi:hypothetical protein
MLTLRYSFERDFCSTTIIESHIVYSVTPVNHDNDVVLTRIQDGAYSNSLTFGVLASHPTQASCFFHNYHNTSPAILVAPSKEFSVFLTKADVAARRISHSKGPD